MARLRKIKPSYIRTSSVVCTSFQDKESLELAEMGNAFNQSAYYSITQHRL